MAHTYATVLMTERPLRQPLRKCEVDLRCIIHWLMHRDEQLTHTVKRGVLRVQSKQSAPYVPSASMLVPDLSPAHDKWYSQAAARIQADPYAPAITTDPRLASALAKLRKDTLMGMAARDFLGREFPPFSTLQGRIVVGRIELLVSIQIDGFDLDTQTAYVVQTREHGLSSADSIKAQMIMHISKIAVSVLVFCPRTKSFALRPATVVPNLCAHILRDFARTL